MKRPEPCEDTGRRHCLQAKKRVLTRNQIDWHLNLGLQVSRTVRNKCLLLKPLSPGYLLCVHVCILSQSGPTLPPPGLSPARRLCPWGFPGKNSGGGLPFPPPGDLPGPGIKSTPPALAGRFFTTEPPGKPMVFVTATQTD